MANDAYGLISGSATYTSSRLQPPATVLATCTADGSSSTAPVTRIASPSNYATGSVKAANAMGAPISHHRKPIAAVRIGMSRIAPRSTAPRPAPAIAAAVPSSSGPAIRRTSGMG